MPEPTNLSEKVAIHRIITNSKAKIVSYQTSSNMHIRIMFYFVLAMANNSDFYDCIVSSLVVVFAHT